MKQLKLEDFFDYQYLSDVQYAPDGKAAAFVVKKANLEDNAYDSSIWLYENGGIRQLTTMGRDGQYVWEDSEHIVFTSNRDAQAATMRKKRVTNTSFYRIAIHGGEASLCWRLPVQLMSFERFCQDVYLIKARSDALHPNYHLLDMEEKERIGRERLMEEDYHVLDEVSFYSNGTGFTNKTRMSLFLYHASTGELEKITDAMMQAEFHTVWQGKIAWIGFDFQQKIDPYQNIYVYDPATRTTECVYAAHGYRFFRIFPVGEKLVVRGCEKDSGYSFHCWGPYWHVDPDAHQLRLFADDQMDMTDNVLTDSKLGGGASTKAYGDAYYFASTIRNDVRLCRVNASGSVEEVYGRSGAINFFDLHPVTGEVLACAMYDGRLPELYSIRLDTGDCKRLTHFNDAVLADTYVADYQPVTIQSEGYEIDGYVLLPKDYDPSKTYPAILDIHGGPKCAYGPVFYHEMQLWANEGYFVFFCNPFGSDGRGFAFQHVFGREGSIDFANLMDFTDEVLHRYPQIDPERVGVTGGSFGGYMTNWIIGHTDRFAAAASQRSISNYVSFYGTSDVYFAVPFQAGGNIYDDVEHMWAQSPLKYACFVSTPTLFVHSDEDYRCPLEQGIQMYTALADLGVETRMCIIKGEHHGLSRVGKPTHRARRLREITDWMNRHLKG